MIAELRNQLRIFFYENIEQMFGKLLTKRKNGHRIKSVIPQSHATIQYYTNGRVNCFAFVQGSFQFYLREKQKGEIMYRIMNTICLYIAAIYLSLWWRCNL